LQSPVGNLASWPLLEVVSEDAYRLRALEWADSMYPFRVLDIGAHVGSFTCMLAQLLPAATFTCVEPSERTAEWLQRNVRRNGLSDRVTIVRAAVASEDGEGILWVRTEGDCAASLLQRMHSQRAVPVPEPVRTLTFTSLVQLSGGPPDIVKLDCEGG
jgi:FkbM family methyltransferase